MTIHDWIVVSKRIVQKYTIEVHKGAIIVVIIIMFDIDNRLELLTPSQSAYCRSLMREKPVVNSEPFFR